VKPRALLLSLVAALSLGAWVRPAGLGEVRAVSIADEGTYTRVVVELSRPAQHSLARLASPARLFLDLDHTWIESPERQPRTAPAASPVVRVRGGQNQLETARVVIELDSSAREHRAFVLEQPYRIVVDVFREGARARAAPAPLQSRFHERPVRRVILDPGHGGKDPGAIGPGGLREKDVALKIARETKRRLERVGLEVYLTRQRDEFLSLEERTRLANQLHGDLFVSIHANASRNRQTSGVETYLLDTRYDRQTARVAARENGTTVGQLSELDFILASLTLSYNERYASRLAHHVHGSLASNLRRRWSGVRDLGVKRGPFLVLFQADMPSVLVEVGFVSNRAEATRLRSDAFVERAAEGIARGILKHRDDHQSRLVAGR
jgi:N-acetylmuramoyl-L-alanine amidase